MQLRCSRNGGVCEVKNAAETRQQAKARMAGIWVPTNLARRGNAE
jgi:hypothetical protein